LFVAAASGADIFILAPDFDPAPIEGIKPHLDELAAQVEGRFPELAFQAEGGIQAHPTLGAGQEQRFPVGLGIGGAQVEGALGKALGRGLTR
jgi:hypothetical protein